MIKIKKYNLEIYNDSKKSIEFDVSNGEKEIDIHIYTTFSKPISVCVVNPNNRRSKFISKEEPVIRNSIEDIKIKGEYYQFKETNAFSKFRINLFVNKEVQETLEGKWKILFKSLEDVRGSISIYINSNNLYNDLKNEISMRRENINISNLKATAVVLYEPGFEEELKKITEDYKFIKISNNIGIVISDVNLQNSKSVNTFLEVLSIPKAERVNKLVALNSLSVITQGISGGINANEEIGVNFLKNNPNISLRGRGVIIGIIDTGIDYLHPDFIYDDKTSKIVYLWDQSKEGKPPEDFYIGTEYTRENINTAIANNDKTLSTDDSGSGTMLAGICAGMGKVNSQYVGVAEDAELIVVKIGTINGDYNDAMISAGYEYVIKKAEELGRSVVINMGFGSNSLVGSSNRDLTELTFFSRGICIVNAAGNEGNTATHTIGKLSFNGEEKDIEIEIEDFEEIITIEVWMDKPDIAMAAIISPSGEVSKSIKVSNFDTVAGIFDLESTTYTITYLFPTTFSGQQQIIISLLNVKSGIWKIRLKGEYISNGIYNAYLPNRALLKPGTRFSNPDPDKTINFPATYRDNITVGTYDSINSTLWPSSSRGYTINNILKPDIVAPGVNIIAPFPGGGYATVTGSAPAAAYTSGCVALLLQYTVEDGNYPRISFVQKLRTFLRVGATRLSNINYPNEDFGYGVLDIKSTFEQIR